MLDIKNLHANVGDKEILRGIDLHIAPGEVHAIMGPNGSGKSTLAHVLSGRENYQVTAGSVTYQGKDLLTMAPEVRAREGVFLAFQYPIEIPGVSTTYFLKAALNAVRKHRGLDELDRRQLAPPEAGGEVERGVGGEHVLVYHARGRGSPPVDDPAPALACSKVERSVQPVGTRC